MAQKVYVYVTVLQLSVFLLLENKEIEKNNNMEWWTGKLLDVV